MQNETVNEVEANKECDNLSQAQQTIADYTLTNEQVQMQKEAIQAIYEAMKRGKHYNQRGTKGAFGSAKNKYKPQTNR
jgi:endonuclease/exonuclease/phosphatase (EEP) superfamily protein YafD